jgi:hypothetical protein
VPFFLTLGNHELVPPKTRPELIAQFIGWLDQPRIAAQRLADDRDDHVAKTYNHWIVKGTDFISMDNATNDMFDDAQMKWLAAVLAADASNPAVHTVVMGGHAALPHGLTCGYSMNSGPQLDKSGKIVYHELLDFRSKTGKQVYLLASHSHFLLEDAFDSDYWRANGGVLPGWIIGTAGATRYRLPEKTGRSPLARTDVYGYLIGTVDADGSIVFTFHEITKKDIPADVVRRYSQATVNWCFEENKSMEPARPNDCADARP